MPTSLFPDHAIQVLIDTRESHEAFADLVSVLIACGVAAIQLRDKHADDRTLLERARILSECCRDTRTLSIVNDRPDLALLAKADAVHVGQDEIPAKEVRQLVGSRLMIGVSTHSLTQACQAVSEGADYLGVGPIFPSTTKEFLSYPDLSSWPKSRRRRCEFPGLRSGHRICDIRQVVSAGASGSQSSPPSSATRIPPEPLANCPRPSCAAAVTDAPRSFQPDT